MALIAAANKIQVLGHLGKQSIKMLLMTGMTLSHKNIDYIQYKNLIYKMINSQTC